MSNQRKLNRAQERRRIEGLRLLARIIARHYLEHPDLYPQPVDSDGDGNVVPQGGRPMKRKQTFYRVRLKAEAGLGTAEPGST